MKTAAYSIKAQWNDCMVRL